MERQLSENKEFAHTRIKHDHFHSLNFDERNEELRMCYYITAYYTISCVVQTFTGSPVIAGTFSFISNEM